MNRVRVSQVLVVIGCVLVVVSVFIRHWPLVLAMVLLVVSQILTIRSVRTPR